MPGSQEFSSIPGLAIWKGLGNKKQDPEDLAKIAAYIEEYYNSKIKPTPQEADPQTDKVETN